MITPLFIFGPSRSGKSTLERLMKSLAGLKCGYENTLLGEVAGRVMGRKNNERFVPLRRLPKALGPKVADVYLKELRLIDEQARVLTTTTPGIVVDAGWIAEHIPSARFIFVRRNLADNALRIFTKFYADPGHEYAYDMKTIVEYISWYERMAEIWLEKLPAATMRVSYDDIISDPQGTLEATARFCGLEAPTRTEIQISGELGCAEPFSEFLAPYLTPGQD